MKSECIFAVFGWEMCFLCINGTALIVAEVVVWLALTAQQLPLWSHERESSVWHCLRSVYRVNSWHKQRGEGKGQSVVQLRNSTFNNDYVGSYGPLLAVGAHVAVHNANGWPDEASTEGKGSSAPVISKTTVDVSIRWFLHSSAHPLHYSAIHSDLIHFNISGNELNILAKKQTHRSFGD